MLIGNNVICEGNSYKTDAVGVIIWAQSSSGESSEVNKFTKEGVPIIPNVTFNSGKATTGTTVNSASSTTENSSSSSSSGSSSSESSSSYEKFTATINNSILNDVANLGMTGTTANSSNALVATAAIVGNKIEVTSVSAGTATIYVIVAENGSITIDHITKYHIIND